MNRSRLFAASLVLTLLSLMFLPVPRNWAGADRPPGTSAAPGAPRRINTNAVTAARPLHDEPSAYHTLPATFYTLKDDFVTKLTLNNKGPNPLAVQPTLFSPDGRRLDAPPVTVAGASFVTLDLEQWVVRGSIFDEGSIQIMYYGQDRELGGHLEITNPEHSLIFAEELMPMTAMSSRLEAVSWQRSTKSHVRLALSNTSDSAVAATIKIDGIAPRQRGPTTIILSPRQTRVVDAERICAQRTGNAPRDNRYLNSS